MVENRELLNSRVVGDADTDAGLETEGEPQRSIDAQRTELERLRGRK